MEAFRVLPTLGGPAPPPAPPSPRVAPRVRQHKDSSAFVILAEVGDAPSGRSSPFRGKGFKGAPSRIPVMSAPSSPGPKKPQPPQGKSAPASPSRPQPSKRVNVKPPSSPRKSATRPAPKPRFPQKSAEKPGSKEELRPKAAVRRNTNSEKPSVVNKQPNSDDTNAPPKVRETTTYDRFGKPVVNKTTLKRRPKPLVNKINDPERLNGRPRPTDKLPTNNRTMTRSRNATSKERKEVSDPMSKSAETLVVNNEPPPSRKHSSNNSLNVETSNILNGHSENLNSSKVENGVKEQVNTSVFQNGSSSVNHNNDSHLPASGNNNTQTQKEQPLLTTTKDPSETSSNNSLVQNYINSINNNEAKSNTSGTHNGSESHLKVKNIPSMYSRSTVAMVATKPLERESSSEKLIGTTKVDIEPVKDETKIPGLNNKQETVVTIERVDIITNKDTSLTTNGNTDIGKMTFLNSNHIDSHKLTPNGDVTSLKQENEYEKSGNAKDASQNKIIIHQSDRNGPVKVIGSEPVKSTLDIEEVIKESIKTETVVAPEEVIEKATETLRKDEEKESKDRDTTGNKEDTKKTNEDKKEESAGHPPDTSELGRNSVSFRSPEIHPVSARRKPSLREKLCGCYGKSKVPKRVPLKERRGCCNSWRFPWFKRGRGPDPPSKGKDKQGCCRRFFCSCCKPQTDTSKPAGQKQGLCRRMFCCCCKPKGEQPPPAQPLQPPPPANQRNQRMPLKREMTKPNFWKRVFCCKCQNRTNDMGSRKSFGSKKDMIPKSRASSIASFPKLEATLVEHTSLMKAAIPVLPICLAWTCLILNIFLPGTGTVLSGFLCICFGKPRFSVKDSTFARFGSFFINLVIGIGQLFTIIFCFVGWGWSIWWGVIMVRLARKYRRIKIAEKNANEPPVVNQNHDVEHGN